MDSCHYPRFTLLFQMLAYFNTVTEAMLHTTVPCDIFIDTIGVGFTYPLVKYVFGATVIAYTHYPTISSDMLS